MFQF